MNDYMIIALLRTRASQADLVTAMRASYDAGAAGSFETRQVADGFIIAFQRSISEDAALLCTDMVSMPTPAQVVTQAINQLAAEFGAFGFEGEDDTEANRAMAGMVLDLVQNAIRTTGWLPFPDDLINAVCASIAQEQEDAEGV